MHYVIYMFIYFVGPPLTIMHYVIYMFIYFLYYGCLQDDFFLINNQKNLSLQKICYLHCVCIFSLSYLEGVGVSLSIKAWERCIKFSNSIPILILFLKLCVLWFN